MKRLGYVADDLTGAADVLAQAHRFGLDGVLLVGGSEAGPEDRVVGVATPARSLQGARLEAAVRDGLARLRGLRPDVLIYKVCSTFDSSPGVGSIGRAIEVLREAYPDQGATPVIPAQPAFGRYTAFSQHFGAYGGTVHRLDRHPVMRNHPSTPMHEADLRLVLAAQLSGDETPPGLHLQAYEDGTFADEWRRMRGGEASAFVVDGVAEEHLRQVAARLLAEAPPALVVGSGGVMTALGQTLGSARRDPPAGTRSSGPALAVSGSASETTARQIRAALSRGWAEVPIPARAVTSGGAERDTVVGAVASALRRGRSVVAHTALGPSDPRLRAEGPLDSASVGAVLAEVVANAVSEGLTRDVAVCGGDTATHALLELKVGSLRVAEQFVTAGPVCHADDGSVLAGCRLLLKGGQVGPVEVLTLFADRDQTGEEAR